MLRAHGGNGYERDIAFFLHGTKFPVQMFAALAQKLEHIIFRAAQRKAAIAQLA